MRAGAHLSAKPRRGLPPELGVIVARLPEGTVVVGKKRRKAWMLNPRMPAETGRHETRGVEPVAFLRSAVGGG